MLCIISKWEDLEFIELVKKRAIEGYPNLPMTIRNNLGPLFD
uniref:Uncharacterized protein n=1 Tax=Rhizophora mucronata TaxID=61149 RepID=A0A2P2QJN2_RHIMU